MTAEALRDAEFLTPFGVEICYPGESPEMLPGDESKAVEIACRVRDAIMALLEQYLAGG